MPDDVQALAAPVISHRITLRNASASTHGRGQHHCRTGRADRGPGVSGQRWRPERTASSQAVARWSQSFAACVPWSGDLSPVPFTLSLSVRRSMTGASATLLVIGIVTLNIIWGYPWVGMFSSLSVADGRRLDHQPDHASASSVSISPLRDRRRRANRFRSSCMAETRASFLPWT